ncbi:hypothetical protein CIB95_11610 [Lottiidibacillus patelloidae]|uniref:Glycosyltransferase n=1 Tax=Lottiidibacillus patelloidae TaxID=2670334 RepID=A0A263BRU1_9BACI|nr:glycosyltransferase [Lottiidibacillus patelloidae]OZM56414.1 hypothetical protein CIB95_11610 [Lottiidibacillus patelloidae]
MKILLLGDYSGFHKNLKDGLMELGYKVDLATSGDGYKKTSKSDLIYPTSRKGLMQKIDMLTFPFGGIKHYYNYDSVQLIGPVPFGSLKFNYNYRLIESIKKRSGKLFLSSCGSNYFVYKIRKELRYNYLDPTIKYDLNGNNPFTKKKYINNNIEIANLVDGIIPTLFTYAEAFRSHPKLLNTIQFPVNINKIQFTPQNIKNNKLKIFHGITREGFKGSKYIIEAMNRLKEKYPNDVEILIDGKMPLDKYLSVLNETNVVIDQALSYEYGMNAVFSMAMGKVVLSGNEQENQEEFKRSDIPVINILPSSDDIYNKLEKLVLNKKGIVEIGEKSRLFVEEFHNHIEVAQKYIDTWNSVEVKNKNG